MYEAIEKLKLGTPIIFETKIHCDRFGFPEAMVQALEHSYQRQKRSFVAGNQLKIMSEQKQKESVGMGRLTTPILKPASFLDALKYYLTKWQPSLKFGWFVPRMIEIRQQQVIFSHTVETKSFYVNLYPVENLPDGVEYTFLRRFDFYPPTFTPETWLAAEPTTFEELMDARDEVRKMSGSESAYFMNFDRPCNSLC